MAFEKYVLPDESDPKMSIHLFRALIQEYIEGQLTGSQVISNIEEHLGVSLTAAEKTDLNDLAALVDAETGIPAKMSVADRIYRVSIISESGLALYDTKAKIKTRLGWG